jgi:hypothetical protein
MKTKSGKKRKVWTSVKTPPCYGFEIRSVIRKPRKEYTFGKAVFEIKYREEL